MLKISKKSLSLLMFTFLSFGLSAMSNQAEGFARQDEIRRDEETENRARLARMGLGNRPKCDNNYTNMFALPVGLEPFPEENPERN